MDARELLAEAPRVVSVQRRGLSAEQPLDACHGRDVEARHAPLVTGRLHRPGRAHHRRVAAGRDAVR